MVAIGAVALVLALAGVFSDDDGEEAETAGTTTAPVTRPEEEKAPAEDELRPKLSTVEVGGRPTAISASPDGVWVADSFSPVASVVRSAREEPIRFRLEGPASDLVVGETGAYFALPEQQAVERRQLEDPKAPGELIELDGFPSVLAGITGVNYALSDRSVEVIDDEAGEVTDEFELDGFGSALWVGEGYLWVAVDNREVVRMDPASGEVEGEPVPVPEAFAIAVDDGFVWVLSASSELTRIAPDSLEATVAPEPVRGALDVAVGLGSVWVTSSRRTVTRFDAGTLKPIGEPLRVGDEAASVSVGDDAIWVANGGDGTLTRIEP